MPDHQNPSDSFENLAPVAPGNALVATTPSMTLPAHPLGLDGAARPDVIRGGMDPVSFFHSFRRRWLLALCMGVLAGALCGALLAWIFAESSSATQLFRVNSTTSGILKDGLEKDPDYDIFRRTQAVLITSQFVLNRAMGTPGVANSSFFNGVEEEKRVQYLAEELSIVFPQDAEVMEISLSDSVPEEELRTIIAAVSEAYKAEVLFQAKTERLQPREILIDGLTKVNRDISRKMKLLEEIMREKKGFGAFDGDIDPESRLMTNDAIRISAEIAAMKQRLMDVRLEFDDARRMLLDPGLLEDRIDEAIADMAETQQYEADLLYQKVQIRDALLSAKGQRASAAIRPMQERYDALAADFDRFKEATKKRMLNEQRTKPNSQMRLLTQQMRQQQAMLSQQVQQAEARVKEITEVLRERGENTTDMIMKQNEIEGLRQVADSIALRIKEWDIEAGAQSRIVEIPGIETEKGINTIQRYTIASLGGVGCFALTVFGIAYLEFRNRRLNGPEQIDEGLGIRVIGTLPGLPGGRALDSRHPVVAQLTESIDSVRTALVHESTSSRRQIVLVTSAAAGEGRTTVASQLAASLARAGRRTLLIDGDLRGPALHNVFDVPLEDGLCEVLRAETDVADVVRPTEAEGLWLITAGYVDADAIHALATDQVQPIFEKLRADYDFIVIDGAPILGLSDSLLFGQHADGAVLSVLRDHTSVPKIHQSAQLLNSVGIRLIGSVVNGVVTKADRRVTHLQAVTPKSAQKQLEQADA